MAENFLDDRFVRLEKVIEVDFAAHNALC